jgi:hypothetical protein
MNASLDRVPCPTVNSNADVTARQPRVSHATAITVPTTADRTTSEALNTAMGDTMPD